MAVSSLAVANELLRLAQEERVQLTNMQLQKLVFFSHGYHLALQNEPLYYEETRAWPFGPVIPNLYEHLQQYGSSSVTSYLPSSEALNEQQRSIIRLVWDAYKQYDAWRLSDISHRPGSPWEKTWIHDRFGPIDPRAVHHYYSQLLSGAGG